MDLEFHQYLSSGAQTTLSQFEPLPDMAVLGFLNSAANKDMMSKLTSNFTFSHNVYNSCLLLMRQNKYQWSKGLSYNCSFGLFKFSK